MVKVLITADAVGGVWQYSLELAGALGERGFEVTLAVLGPVSPARLSEADVWPNVRVFAHPGKLEWMEDPWRDVAAAGGWLLHLADRFQPDVIHLNGYSHAALPWRVPTVVVAHSCVLSWFAAVRGTAEPDVWNRYRKAVTEGLNAADLVVAPSRAMLESLEANYGPLPRTKVILNGRRPHGFYVDAKEPYILTAGRLWDDAKNIRVLAAVSRNLQWPVFVAGDCQHPDGGAASLDGLQLLGVLDSASLAKWYSRAAIYAHPALYEPFGLTVLEAALSGCALVLSDIPSLREIWGDNAVYADPGDSKAWEVALQSLTRDDARRAQLAQAAGARALELNAATMIEQYLEAYQEAGLHRPCVSLYSVIPFDRIGIMETHTSSGV